MEPADQPELQKEIDYLRAKSLNLTSILAQTKTYYMATDGDFFIRTNSNEQTDLINETFPAPPVEPAGQSGSEALGKGAEE
jgi:hypothetical protein